jgi:hypothetical protein
MSATTLSIRASAASASGVHGSDLANPATLREARTLFLRFPSPRILIGLTAATTSLRLAAGGWSPWDAAVFAAVALYWPVQEWFLHVHLLHMRPFELFGLKVDPTFARTHRAHHRRPWDLATTVLPTRVVLPLVPLSVLAWLLLMPTTRLALTAMATYSAMALLYEWTHYLTHTAYRPRGAFYRRIWRNHRLHHFKNERYWHAFVLPQVDRWLGTDPHVRDVPTSPTCRTLGIAGGSDAAENG